MRAENVPSTILVTGAAGFVGSAFVRRQLKNGRRIVSLDKLTYAADLRRLGPLDVADHTFIQGAVEDAELVRNLLNRERPDAVVHFAAESHVDRSIDGPRAFLEANTRGTFELLDASLAYFRDTLSDEERASFRFLHISTDEVYGAATDRAFAEEDAFFPNSPYSASKAAAETFVRAYHRTYALPTLIARPANTYGPWQFPEKLIPLMISRSLEADSLPVYGDGRQRREWLYVDDHCDGIAALLERGAPGCVYNLPGYEELENLSVVGMLCAELDRIRPRPGGAAYADLVRHVADRPGHDRRYAIDGARARADLGWQPRTPFKSGLAKTVEWYLDHEAWWRDLRATRYGGERLGVGAA